MNFLKSTYFHELCILTIFALCINFVHKLAPNQVSEEVQKEKGARLCLPFILFPGSKVLHAAEAS